MKYRIVVETVNGSVICGEAKETGGKEEIDDTNDLLGQILGSKNGFLKLEENNNIHFFRADRIVRASIEAVE